ncbi:rRNA biogenesis protein RRP5 [Chlorella vulgaris]
MVQKRKPDEGAIEEEETFVRGGGSGLAPVVKKQLEQEAYAEAEADLLAGSSKKGGKRRKSDASGAAAAGVGDEEDAFFRGLALQDKLPKYVELLKFRNLSRGCKLWGAVIEVTSRELVVSLPHGLRGLVPYAEASDWLHEQSKKAALADAAADVHAAAEAGGKQSGSGKKRKAPGPGAAALPALIDLFSIGQLVRATVTAVRSGGGNEAGNDQAGAKAASADAKDGSKKKATKRVMLSLRVSKMNGGLGPESLQGGMALPACVRSVEDHGFTLALGIKGVSGFLSKKEAAAAGRPLAPGVLLDVVVPAGGAPKPAGGGSSVVHVTCLPEAVATAVSHEWEGLNIGSLLPGQLVTARVRNVLSDGLLCSFLTYFSGTVDPFHLGTDLTADWRKQFSPNQRLRARILFVDPETKRVGLSLQRHLLADTLPPNFPMLGQVFSEAVVRRMDEGLGLLLELPAEAPATMPLTPGYAHISNLGEDKVEDIGKRFRPGQKLRARVLGFRPMDGLAVLSLKPSVVDSHILSIAGEGQLLLLLLLLLL